MHTLFISDLHLSHNHPKITRAFFTFLNKRAIYADALYILGDLFELWIGDDDNQFLHAKVASELLKIKNQGVPCYFIHGNRDFLIGKNFADQSGIILLPQEIFIKLYGKKILILHGDILCTDDVKYQFFRYFMHQNWIKNLFLSLPLFIRKYIVSYLFFKKKNLKKLIDVNVDTVINFIKKYEVSYMIHGHTHKASINNINILNTKRIVLGAWYKKGSMVEVNTKSIILIEFIL